MTLYASLSLTHCFLCMLASPRSRTAPCMLAGLAVTQHKHDATSQGIYEHVHKQRDMQSCRQCLSSVQRAHVRIMLLQPFVAQHPPRSCHNYCGVVAGSNIALDICMRSWQLNSNLRARLWLDPCMQHPCERSRWTGWRLSQSLAKMANKSKNKRALVQPFARIGFSLLSPRVPRCWQNL